jgi:hypothetical protein
LKTKIKITMKKSFRQLLAVIAIVAASALSSNGQELGIRFGGTNGYGGAAIDGVFGAGQFSRIHADLGFYRGGMGIDALWDFLYKPINEEALNWYLGVGPSMYIGDIFQIGASGEIGVEYRFAAAPVAIGFDWRPTLWIVDEHSNTSFGADSFGLNVRYVFGK